MKIVRPRRITRSYVQIIQGTPEEIFPLYCPVKEARWCEGWDPIVVYSESGVVELDCVFVTSDGETEATWFVTGYDPAQGLVQMVKHTPGVTFVKLCIALEPVTAQTTRATISYSHTALSRAGDKVLEGFTEESYATMMQAWETAMNHYLKTGDMLTGLAEF
jgi:hypothetical protein